MKPGFYIDWYDDLFIFYSSEKVEIWSNVFGWVETNIHGISGSWKLIELF